VITSEMLRMFAIKCNCGNFMEISSEKSMNEALEKLITEIKKVRKIIIKKLFTRSQNNAKGLTGVMKTLRKKVTPVNGGPSKGEKAKEERRQQIK
jgi:hypothetical protein